MRYVPSEGEDATSRPYAFLPEPEADAAAGRERLVEELGTERAPTTIGVMAGDGKMAGMTMLRFDSGEKAKAYMKACRHSTGHNKGKSCQMGSTTILSMDRLGAQKIGEFGGNPNHKGHKS